MGSITSSSRRALAGRLAFASLALVGSGGFTVVEDAAPATALLAEEEAYACRQDTHERVAGVAPSSVHVAGLVEAPNGDLLYHMDGNSLRGPDPHRPTWGIARAFVSRMPVGSNTWLRPVEIPYDEVASDTNPVPFESAHNTVMFNDGDGRLHNWFTTRQGTSHADSTLDYRYSDDSGYTWSDPEVLRAEHGWMFGNRPFRMSNGELIVPIYKEAAPWGVGFFISDDNFQTYSTNPAGELPWPGIGVGGLQGAATEVEPGHLLVFMRTQARYIYRTESFDHGRTWTPAVPTEFPNPWARVDLLQLDSGNLLLAYNPSGSNRTPLVLALSEDGGLTWPYSVTVEDEPAPARHSYPYLLQTEDGWIHLGYSHREQTSMRHVVFNEEWVREGADMTSNPAYVKTEVRGTQTSEVAACDYFRTPDAPVATELAYVGDATYSNATRLAASLRRDEGSPVAGREVVFRVGDTEYPATTDQTGVASTVVKFTGAKPQTVTMSFAGDRWFEPASATVTLQRKASK